MRIVICGSVNFPEKMKEIEKRLKKRGHDIVLPYSLIKHSLNSTEDARKLKESSDYIKDIKPELTKRHFDEIKNSDAIVVVNAEKNGISNYIGGATFSEIMLAFYVEPENHCFQTVDVWFWFNSCCLAKKTADFSRRIYGGGRRLNL